FYLISLLYLFLIIFLYQGWRKLKNPVKEKDIYSDKVKVAVIIPARNEETNIVNLLNDIDSQNYPEPWIEVIVADDASGDGTAEVVKEWADIHSLNVKLLNLEDRPGNPSPKKRALSQAINHSTADLIITTDADCRVGKNWISAIVQHYESTEAKMISGPVRFIPLTSFFTKIQALEFLSLVGSGAAAIGQNNPLMCNGANLAFSRKAFFEVGGYYGNENYASGDDVFLMLKMKRHYGHFAISFLKDPKIIVDTPPKPNWHGFINQRTRWASKTKAYRDSFSLFTSGVVFLFCVTLLLIILLLVVGQINPVRVVTLWAVKLIVDVFFLWRITGFMKQAYLMKYFIPAQLFVVLYTTIAGFLGSLGGFSWKGRAYK
ncbi:MAG: glycosyltransferase, partial [Bacteroidales bacterium]|nr:glycosyltransferase [Bacteroidales bacterium]